MAQAYNVVVDPNDPNRIIITATDDGNEMNTTYSENAGTGGSNESATTEIINDGIGNNITWSTPVQDGTRGILGGRGPGVFNRAVTMTRPSTFLSSSISAGEVTSIEGDFSSFLTASVANPRTVQIGTSPVQVFIYTGKGAGDLSLTGPSQTLLEQANGSAVTGYFDAPSIGDNSTAVVTIGGQDLTLTYNQISLQTICNDQNGAFNTAGASTTLTTTLLTENVTSITVADTSNFTSAGLVNLVSGSFTYTSKTSTQFLNSEPQTVQANTSGSAVTQAANSCSITSGVPIGGDTSVITFLESSELPGNTTTLSAIHDGTGTADDDWTEFELVIDGDLLVQGTVVAEALIVDGATLVPNPDGNGELTVGQINADNINANQITTAKLAAGAATFDKIDLNGQLRVSTEGSGAISWGKNDANDVNSVGLYLGNANATNPDPRFVLGNSSSYIWFDGEDLYIVGATETTPNLEPECYSTAGTFFYTIAPNDVQLGLELSGAGGGGGAVNGTATAGGSSTITVQRRTRIIVDGVDEYETRAGLMEGGNFESEGLTVATTSGSTQTEIFVSTLEGFTREGNIDLVTTSSGGSVLDTGTFNYESTNNVPNNTAQLRVSIDGRQNGINTLIVSDVTGWPSTGTVVFADGEEFPYTSTNTDSGINLHEFRNNSTDGIRLGVHTGAVDDITAEDLEDINRTRSFVSVTAQDVGTHVLRTQVVPSSTTITGNDHVFTTAGGAAGVSGFTDANGDGQAGGTFDARLQVGDLISQEGKFRGDGGTAGDFDGTKSGGIGGRGQGVNVNGETLDVSDGGGGGAATSEGDNDGGTGGGFGIYLSVHGSALGDGRYTIVSATDRLQVVVGLKGNGAQDPTNGDGGNGGDGLVLITGV